MPTAWAAAWGIVAVTSALAGCASGRIPVRLEVPGQPPAPVSLDYQSSLFGGTGKLSTVLPGGERFAGDYRLVPKDPDASMQAALSGSRGNLLICRFLLNKPGIGPSQGGTVRCQLSSGGILDGQF